MSLQVRNGYEIKEVRSLHDLELFFKQVRSVMQPIYEKMRNAKLIEQAVSIYDDICINEEEVKQYLQDHTILSISNQKLEQETEEIRKISKREVEYDFDVEICFFFENHRLFATIYTEREEYTEAWEGIMNVQPFSYWETSTTPSGIKKEDWFDREMVWKNIFSGSSYPQHNGIVLYPIQERTSKQKELKPFIPTLETRIKNKSLQQRNKELETHILTYINPNQIMAFVDEFMEKKVSEEWKNRLKEIEEEVGIKLNSKLTIHDLVKKPNEVLEGR